MSPVFRRHFFILVAALAAIQFGGRFAAGDSVVGDTAAGDSVVGDSAAGDTVAGDTSAGDTVAGDTVAGDTAAGDTVAGDTAKLTHPVEAARRTDRLLAETCLSSPEVHPASIVDDQTFLRRVTLDLWGRLPTPDEVTSFSLDSAPDKRSEKISQLLSDPSYGRHWARYWRDVIFYRRSDDRGLLAATALERKMTEDLNRNKPWDEIAQSFFTVIGDVQEKGETAIFMAQGGDPEGSAAEFSRIFLGIQIQCAQCHDHKTDRWTREQFHELAAFFPRVAIRPERGQQRTFHVVAQDYFPRKERRNNNNRYRGTLEHRMSDLDNPDLPGTLMQPVFFLGDKALPSGVPDQERRESLAEWMTDAENPWFARALVNRLWTQLLGVGFYEPVDDMGPDRDCEGEEVLQFLCDQFVEQDYDLKWLLATIMNSDAYQRASFSDVTESGHRFACGHPKRLSADQLFDSLVQALDVPLPDPPSVAGDGMNDKRKKRGRGAGPRRLFTNLFGFDPSTPREEVAGSISQALALMNLPVIDRMVSADRPGGLRRWLEQFPEDEDLVDELYLRALAREPTAAETTNVLDYVKAADSRQEAFEDLLWTLVNSTEFRYWR